MQSRMFLTPWIACMMLGDNLLDTRCILNQQKWKGITAFSFVLTSLLFIPSFSLATIIYLNFAKLAFFRILKPHFYPTEGLAAPDYSAHIFGACFGLLCGIILGNVSWFLVCILFSVEVGITGQYAIFWNTLIT